MNENNDAIKLKIIKAEALMAEVDLLLENKFYTTAVSRIYYSCFHAVKALLLTKDLVPKTHSGTVSMLGQHFVITGLFNTEQSAFFSNLMQERMDDDYSDFMISDYEDIKEYVEPGKLFLKYVIRLIGSH